MFDEPLVLQLKLSLVDTIQPHCNKLVGMKIEATGVWKFNDSPEHPTILTIQALGH